MPKKKKPTEGEETKKTKVAVTTKKAPESKKPGRKKPLWHLLPRWTFGELLTTSSEGSEAILKTSSFPS